MWPNTFDDMHDHLQPSTHPLTMQKDMSSLFPTFWPEDVQGTTEDSESILLLDSESPLGSELSLLPPLSHPTLDMTFLDDSSNHDHINLVWSSEPPSSHLDSALEDYTQTWRKLVHESSILASTLFSPSQHQPNSALSFDPEDQATPPLAFDFDLPSAPSTVPEPIETRSHLLTPPHIIEVVAPKPIRLTNPAIHLAALVEDSTSAEDALEAASREYGYSKEQLREYMSDSDSSDGSDDEEEEADIFSPSLDILQFTYPTFHDMSECGTVSTSPMTALPPATPITPITYHTTPQLSRSSQLRDTMRERRDIRQGHSRHSSVPDIHYRPTKWTEAVRPVRTIMPMRVRRRRTEQVSHSVDWSVNAQYSAELGAMPYSLEQTYQ